MGTKVKKSGPGSAFVRSLHKARYLLLRTTSYPADYCACVAARLAIAETKAKVPQVRSGLEPVPHAPARSIPLRLEQPSRWQHHGLAWLQCGASRPGGIGNQVRLGTAAARRTAGPHQAGLLSLDCCGETNAQHHLFACYALRMQLGVHTLTDTPLASI